jgi:hypothetical protein
MRSTLQGEVLNGSALDIDGWPSSTVREDASVKEPHPADLAEIALDSISRIARPCPNPEVWPQVVWYRIYAFSGEDSRDPKG